LDQSPEAEQALSIAQTLAREYNGSIILLTVLGELDKSDDSDKAERPSKIITNEAGAIDYLNIVASNIQSSQYQTFTAVKQGDAAKIIGERARRKDIDLMVMSTHGRSRFRRWLVPSITSKIIYQTTPPLLVVRPSDNWHSIRTQFKNLLVTLDGSVIAEQVLPYVHEIANHFKSEVTLLSVPEGSESDEYSTKLKHYIGLIAKEFINKGIKTNTLITGSGPARTILNTAEENKIDLIMMVSHGRGGVVRQNDVKLGSFSDIVLQETPCPGFLVSALKAL
jgi:nucleotide-binding universal stress UspA family protein